MIEQLIQTVRDASRLMLTDTFDITQKAGYANIVTSTDVAVQDFLKQRLAALLPGSGFLCEEDDRHQPARDCTWIIDPIDGTANYARGIDQCAICVGLRQADAMRMAVVYLPRTGELFHAEAGRGAYRNGQRIHVSARPFADAVLATALPVYHKQHAAVCGAIIGEAFALCNDIRRFGAAAPELCYLAMGRIELYFEYLLSPWDYAAASLIVSEAGGCLTDLRGHVPSLDSPTGIVAANNAESLARLQNIVQTKIADYSPRTASEQNTYY